MELLDRRAKLMHGDAQMPDPITQTMTRMNRRHSYKRERDVESGCIYRRIGEPEHEGPLTDEHIIAQSVGGMLVLCVQRLSRRSVSPAYRYFQTFSFLIRKVGISVF